MESLGDIARVWWVVSGMLVLLMQIGFVYLEMGCVRPKDRPGIAVKNLTILIVSTVAYLVVGRHLMYGETVRGMFGFGGVPRDYPGIPDAYSWEFLQVGFAAVAATIVSGAIAGRSTLFSNVVVALVVSGVLFPIFGHWVWGGGLLSGGAESITEFHDFAGSGTVHFLGGMVALVAAWITGPRLHVARGKRCVRDLPSATIGVVLLWIGWIGFNGGSVSLVAILEAGGFRPIGSAAMSTTFAACGGATIAIAMAAVKEWRLGNGEGLPLRECFRLEILFDPFAMLSGTMAGMVAVTANCDWIDGDSVSSFFIGAAGGFASYLIARLVERLGIDDPVEAIAVHAGGGGTGVLLAAAAPQYSFSSQLIGILAATVIVIAVTLPVFLALRRKRLLRVPRAREEVGLSYMPMDEAFDSETVDFDALWFDGDRISNAKLSGIRVRLHSISKNDDMAGHVRRLLEGHVIISEQEVDVIVILIDDAATLNLTDIMRSDPCLSKYKVIALSRSVAGLHNELRRADLDNAVIIKASSGWRIRLVETIVEHAISAKGGANQFQVLRPQGSRLMSITQSFAVGLAVSIISGYILQFFKATDANAVVSGSPRANPRTEWFMDHSVKKLEVTINDSRRTWVVVDVDDPHKTIYGGRFSIIKNSPGERKYYDFINSTIFDGELDDNVWSLTPRVIRPRNRQATNIIFRKP